MKTIITLMAITAITAVILVNNIRQNSIKTNS
ncbi:hypothetical protein JOD96_001599 [Flavobacterium sp. 1355]|jgi:hypothetical protein|nr:hypothetical protein [Flavobacterium sp. 1355]